MGYQITSAGPLHTPSLDISVKRDKNLDIILENALGENASSAYSNPLPGTVRMVSGEVSLRSQGGLSALATGVLPLGTTPKWNKRAQLFTTTERASVAVIEIETNIKAREAFLVEWFLIRSYPISWPEISETETRLRHTAEIAKGPDHLSLRLEATAASQVARNTLTLSIEGHRIYLREISAKKRDKGRSNYMLIYCDETTLEFRRKLQECLSITLGRYLVYLGHTGFSEAWKIVRLRAVSSYSINKDVFKLLPQPPAPLSPGSYNRIDAATFNKHVSALFKNYEVLNLSQLSWGYWHAMCAPAHFAAAHYGALIESLRDAYIKSRPDLRGGKIVNDAVIWAKISGAMRAALEGAGLEDDARRILNNKLSNLNSRPTSSLLDIVCKSVGIHLGDSELGAWKRRNSAAHGARIKAEDYLSIFRDNMLLNVILMRMLTAMTEASNNYIDYCSIGHPVRPLADPVPDQHQPE